jgi:hypothetical protein
MLIGAINLSLKKTYSPMSIGWLVTKYNITEIILEGTMDVL